MVEHIQTHVPVQTQRARAGTHVVDLMHAWGTCPDLVPAPVPGIRIVHDFAKICSPPSGLVVSNWSA